MEISLKINKLREGERQNSDVIHGDFCFLKKHYDMEFFHFGRNIGFLDVIIFPSEERESRKNKSK